MAPFSGLPSFTPTWHRTSYPSISPLSNPNLSMASKNILITGGGSGAGLAILRSFACAGAANIGILGRRVPLLEAAAASISAEFPATKIHTYAADVTDEAAVNAAFTAFEKEVGKIHVGIHNAGFAPTVAPLSSLSSADFKLGVDINVLGSLNVIQAFLRTAAPEAVLVYVSSGAMHLPTMAGWSGYTVGKEAATKLFSHVGVENPGIRVHSINPGLLRTEMAMKNVPKEDQDQTEWDDVSLAGDFTVWISSHEAKFLDGTFVWSNWDVEEMKARAEEIGEGYLLRMGLHGWP